MKAERAISLVGTNIRARCGVKTSGVPTMPSTGDRSTLHFLDSWGPRLDGRQNAIQISPRTLPGGFKNAMKPLRSILEAGPGKKCSRFSRLLVRTSTSLLAPIAPIPSVACMFSLFVVPTFQASDEVHHEEPSSQRPLASILLPFSLPSV